MVSVFRLIAKGFGIKLPEPKEKPLPPGFRGIVVNNTDAVMHDLPEPGGLPEPTKPPPKPADAKRSVTSLPTYVAFEPTPQQRAFIASVGEVPPWPAGRPRYGLDYLGPSLSDMHESPKKKPDRHVPVLDDRYFEEKREREYYMHPPVGFSASHYGGYGASYYGVGTGGIIMHEAALCRQFGHDYVNGRCYRCLTPER